MIRTQALLAGVLMLAFAGAAQAGDIRDVVHDETSGTVVRSTSGECVRSNWSNSYDECSGAVMRTAEISREERTVYFGFNQASISPQMKQRLDLLATRLKSEQSVRGARIVGYADRIGNPDYNERLSKKRAEAVKNYLVARGLINTQVAETRWVGASEPSTECPADLKRPALIDCLQKDRRVEVEIDYAPEVRASR